MGSPCVIAGISGVHTARSTVKLSCATKGRFWKDFGNGYSVGSSSELASVESELSRGPGSAQYFVSLYDPNSEEPARRRMPPLSHEAHMLEVESLQRKLDAGFEARKPDLLARQSALIAALGKDPLSNGSSLGLQVGRHRKIVGALCFVLLALTLFLIYR